MCLIDCKISEIWDKQKAIHWWALVFETFEEYADALYPENEEEKLKLMTSSQIYYEQASWRLRSLDPLTSQISFDISKKISELIKIFPI